MPAVRTGATYQTSWDPRMDGNSTAYIEEGEYTRPCNRKNAAQKGVPLAHTRLRPRTCLFFFSRARVRRSVRPRQGYLFAHRDETTPGNSHTRRAPFLFIPRDTEMRDVSFRMGLDGRAGERDDPLSHAIRRRDLSRRLPGCAFNRPRSSGGRNEDGERSERSQGPSERGETPSQGSHGPCLARDDVFVARTPGIRQQPSEAQRNR